MLGVSTGTWGMDGGCTVNKVYVGIPCFCTGFIHNFEAPWGGRGSKKWRFTVVSVAFYGCTVIRREPVGGDRYHTKGQ